MVFPPYALLIVINNALHSNKLSAHVLELAGRKILQH